MKTYFITGGAGFIGSTLTERLLKEGNKVVTIDNFCDYYDPKIKEKNIKDFINNDNYKLYRGDIRDKGKTFKVDYKDYVSDNEVKNKAGFHWFSTSKEYAKGSGRTAKNSF